MNMMATLNLRAMVTNEDGEPRTNSYAVAEAFGKRHSDVLKAIRNMKCSDGFAKRNFALCFEISKLQNGKPLKFYQITKDGWMFLVMGFKGQKADAIKEQFIEAFNWMADQITQSFQVTWARYNAVTTHHKNRKDQVSKDASSMASWRWEKQPLEVEIAQLEKELQPQLEFTEKL